MSLSRPRRKRNAILAAVLSATAGASALAQDSVARKETITTRPGDAALGAAAGVATTVAAPSPRPLDTPPQAVTASGSGSSRARDSAGTPAWKGVQARAFPPLGPSAHLTIQKANRLAEPRERPARYVYAVQRGERVDHRLAEPAAHRRMACER